MSEEKLNANTTLDKVLSYVDSPFKLFAITEAYTGTGYTRQVAKILCSGAGEKILRIVARCGSTTVAVQFDVNLYTSAGVYVTTLLAPSSKTLTTSYQ